MDDRLADGEIWSETVHPQHAAPRATVILLPPTSRNSAYWPSELLDALVAAGLTTIRVDLRDQGRSPWGGRYDIEDLVADLDQVRAASGAGAVRLVGVGLGALVAQAYAIDHAARVERIALVGSTPWYVDPRLAGSPEELVSGIWLRRRTESREETIRTLVRNEAAIAGAGHFDEAATEVAATAWVDHGYNPDDRHREILVRSADQRDRLAGVAAPALVVHGRADPYMPLAHAECLAGALADATLLVVDGLGHGLPPGGAGAGAGAVIAAIVDHLAR